MYASGPLRYLAVWPDEALLARVLGRMAGEAGLVTVDLPADLRLRRAGDVTFAFNYGPDIIDLEGIFNGELVIGNGAVPPAGVAAWR